MVARVAGNAERRPAREQAVAKPRQRFTFRNAKRDVDRRVGQIAQDEAARQSLVGVDLDEDILCVPLVLHPLFEQEIGLRVDIRAE